MTKINDGGPAFQRISFLEKNDAHAPERRSTYSVVGTEGMSMRAYFAGQALVSTIIKCIPYECEDGETMEQMFARKAVSVADALIAELAKDTAS